MGKCCEQRREDDTIDDPTALPALKGGTHIVYAMCQVAMRVVAQATLQRVLSWITSNVPS